MSYQDIKIEETQAEQILLKLFGIEGTASALPGEVDFNFRIKVNGQAGYILKVSRPDENKAYLEYQQQLLQHVEQNGKDLIAPRVITDKRGHHTAAFQDELGHTRKVRLLTWIPGRLWSSVNPQLDSLRYSLGEQCGLLTQALQGFDHPQAHREFQWDVAQVLWTAEHLDLFEGREKEIISTLLDRFRNALPHYEKLRKGIVHNDANDNNLIVSEALVHPQVVAAIDYGDAVYTQVINDLAIACTYAIMGQNDPLAAALPIVRGYHSQFPLQEEELKHLYTTIAMRLTITVTKSAINKQAEPDNSYLLISEKPAWDVLHRWIEISPEFAEYSFRNACGYAAHPAHPKFETWSSGIQWRLTDLFPTIEKQKAHLLDLSVGSKWLGHVSSFNDLHWFQFRIEQLLREFPDQIPAGGYCEPRPIYDASDNYGREGNSGVESRTTHLGVDFWLPALTPVHAMFDGEIVTAANDSGFKTYGGLIILKHQGDGFEFYSLYGHLSLSSLEGKRVGDILQKGDRIGYLGDMEENGCWSPHLHFQLLLSPLDYVDDFPGVAYPSEIDVWKSICPDPNLLFKLDNLSNGRTPSNEELIAYRQKHLGKSLSLQYKVPIKMVRGAGAYLVDQFGNKYLDTVNNVAHVGHEHPAVVKAGQQQMALLNTNSRYLHDNINALAAELIATLPPELNVLHFVNSGSEANELAIRMAKASTGQHDVIASQVGYHGNTNSCVDISSYKFDGKGGSGAPQYTHIFPLPDTFRGKHTGPDAGAKYAEEVQVQIDKIAGEGRNIAAFIIESIISCGGQIELPEGFLADAYQRIRKAGGVCISDEVQVGCGRSGKYFWGFQLYDVVPDIVTMGKPLGNGHPLAAVACTQEVADQFANGMEYFNTFGGNPVSCAIGTEVLKTVKREGLQQHALKVGEFLKSELWALSEQFPIIGDVRGQGLFLGIELVDQDKRPLGAHADYLANRMKDHRILMSTDGPDHNVLKIKPPMVFSQANAERLIQYLRRILAEDFMRSVEGRS